MGCDIHIIVEYCDVTEKLDIYAERFGKTASPEVQIELKKQADWILYNFPENATNRNYERFAALAGVRGDGPRPRGIPDNVSRSTA